MQKSGAGLAHVAGQVVPHSTHLSLGPPLHFGHFGSMGGSFGHSEGRTHLPLGARTQPLSHWHAFGLQD